jgi:hypothetical protein
MTCHSPRSILRSSSSAPAATAFLPDAGCTDCEKVKLAPPPLSASRAVSLWSVLLVSFFWPCVLVLFAVKQAHAQVCTPATPHMMAFLGHGTRPSSPTSPAPPRWLNSSTAWHAGLSFGSSRPGNTSFKALKILAGPYSRSFSCCHCSTLPSPQSWQCTGAFGLADTCSVTCTSSARFWPRPFRQPAQHLVQFGSRPRREFVVPPILCPPSRIIAGLAVCLLHSEGRPSVGSGASPATV